MLWGVKHVVGFEFYDLRRSRCHFLGLKAFWSIVYFKNTRRRPSLPKREKSNNLNFLMKLWLVMRQSREHFLLSKDLKVSFLFVLVSIVLTLFEVYTRDFKTTTKYLFFRWMLRGNLVVCNFAAIFVDLFWRSFCRLLEAFFDFLVFYWLTLGLNIGQNVVPEASKCVF